MCRLLKVSKAGFYAWCDRVPSKRSQDDARFLASIRTIHATSRQTYGSPRVFKQLQRDGITVGKKRVARLMKAHGIVVKTRRKYKATTSSKHDLPIAKNVLDRKFAVDAIGATDRVWAGDITYVWTLEGWLYLAVVLDLRSRRVVGWSMSQSMERGLVLDALRMALLRRRPGIGVLHHSDRGSQYASADCRNLLEKHGMTSSMSRKGNCWDNAVVESFNATIKTELIHRIIWKTREDVRAAIYEYIELWYNSKRLHSTLGYWSPVEFEENESDNAA
jgi:transposase InsO family protein